MQANTSDKRGEDADHRAVESLAPERIAHDLVEGLNVGESDTRIEIVRYSPQFGDQVVRIADGGAQNDRLPERGMRRVRVVDGGPHRLRQSIVPKIAHDADDGGQRIVVAAHAHATTDRIGAAESDFDHLLVHEHRRMQ